MRLKPMTQEDITRVAALCGQLGYPSTAGEVAARFSELSEHSDHAVFVAQDDAPATEEQVAGPLAGWIHVHRTLTLETDPFAEIGGLVVAEGVRGRGVGRLLVTVAERWAIDHGYDEMRVRSNVVRERAHAFYRGLGYEVIKSQLNFRKRLHVGGAEAGSTSGMQSGGLP